jgi:hypothetical protein
MKTLRLLARLAPVMPPAFLIGCGNSHAVKSPFAHRGAVFYAEAGPDNATSPVEKNCSLDAEGRPKRYQGAMLLQQGAVEVHYDHLGTILCPKSADGKEWDSADVYVLVITGKKIAAETIPVVYKGGQLVVVDRPGLRVVLTQSDSKPVISVTEPASGRRG